MDVDQKLDHKNFCALLPPVKKWLEGGAKHVSKKGLGFNMNFVLQEDRPDYANKNCGTAMCIGGAIIQFNKMEIHEIGMSALAELRDKFPTIENEIYKLFYPYSANAAFSKITPTMALQAIDNFEKTGNARWHTIEYDGKDLNPTEENDY